MFWEISFEPPRTPTTTPFHPANSSLCSAIASPTLHVCRFTRYVPANARTTSREVTDIPHSDAVAKAGRLISPREATPSHHPPRARLVFPAFPPCTDKRHTLSNAIMMFIRFQPCKAQNTNLARFAHPPPLIMLWLLPSFLFRQVLRASLRYALRPPFCSAKTSSGTDAPSIAPLSRALALLASAVFLPPLVRRSRSPARHVARAFSLTCFAGFARRPSLRSGKPALPAGATLPTALHNQISATPRKNLGRLHQTTLQEPHIAQPPLAATRSALGDGIL